MKICPVKTRNCLCLLTAFVVFTLVVVMYDRETINATYESIYCDQLTRYLWNLSSNGVSDRTNECSPNVDKPTSTRREKYNPITYTEVQVCGLLLERIQHFNDELNRLRSEILSSRKTDDWKPLANRAEIKLLWTSSNDFFFHLKDFPQLEMLALPWDTTAGMGTEWSSFHDKSNLLVQSYHQWTADDPLCTWIETPGTIRMKYDVTYNRTCHRDISQSVEAQSMDILVLNAKPINSAHYWPNDGAAFPQCFYTQQPPFAFHLFVIRDGIVTDTSEVYSGNAKLVQYSCSHNLKTIPPADVDSIPLYDEIFSIAQFWGSGVFHRMVEEIPRLSLFLRFLKQNPNIKILVTETEGRTAELVKILGLSETRLISGTFRARVIYLPRSTPCGFANVQEVQVLSLFYRNYITSSFPSEPRNKLILIKRSGSRRFTEQLEIERMLEEAAKTFHLNFLIFNDNPVPSLNDTMRMFHSAVMVVAPHGAGLSNVLFSQPGTYVIEGVCNLPHVNFCFQRLSYVLGHHWHGTPSRGGCEGVVDIPAERIRRAVVLHLRQLKSSIT